MREVFITSFAFLITLSVLLPLSRGSGQNYDNDNIYRRKLKQRWMVSPVKRRLLGTHPLLQPELKKWTINGQHQTIDRRKIVNQATFGSNYSRFNFIQKNIKKDDSKGKPLAGNHVASFIDRKPRPGNSLHNQEIERFKKVLRKHIKVKPRQEIEYVSDNQGTGEKQNEFESPRYEEVTNDNSNNREQNGFNNNYVTIIDNIDGKDTADSYSSLSSDEAKNEYTNVENSINEGANEESQMLGKEVNDVLGALTKSDSRIGQVVGTKLPQAQPGGLPFKQTLSSYNDKGDDVAMVDDGREEGKNSQSRPLQAHPGALSFMQALSPYNDKANDVSSVDDGREEGSQSRPPQAHPGGLSYMQALSPAYNDKGNDVATMHDGREEGSQSHPPQAHPGGLPFKQTISPYNDKGDAGVIMDDGRGEGKYTQGRPPGDITVIEDEEVNPNEETSPVLSAPVWNAIQLAEKNFTSQHKVLQSNGDTQNGKAVHETHAPTYFPPPERLPGNITFHHPSTGLSDLENTLNMFAGSKPQSDVHNITEEPVHIHSKGNKQKLFLAGDAEEGPDGTGINIEINHTSIQSPVATHFNHLQNGNTSKAMLKSAPESNSSFSSNSPGNEPAFKMEHNDLHNEPWNANSKEYSAKLDSPVIQTNKTDQKNGRYQNVGTGMPFQLTASNVPLQVGEKVVNSNSGPPGSANIGRLANDFVNSKVHFSEQNVNDGPKAGKAVQSNFPTQRVPQVTTVAHDHVSVIDTKLVSPEPSGNEEGFASPKKPHTESEYAYGSQSNEYLGQKNSANQLSDLQQGSSTFPWDLVNQLSAKDASLYQTDIPSKQKYNTEIQVQHKGRQPDHGQPAFAASRDNEQNKQHMKGMDVLPKQSVHFQRGNRSLDSWSEEYQSLIEKLKDLYGKAHGNSSPGQSASSSNKPAFNDTQQMMQEVARFHSLFVGRDSNPRGIVEDKGMFFKDLKGDDAKPEHWGNAGQMSTSDYLPYIPNKDRENYSGVSNQNISTASFENSAEVLGQVRSIQVANKTLFGTSNSTNLPKEVLNMADPNNSNIEKVVNGTVEENNGNVSNNSDSLSSQHDGRSSHQVLMSYFRNETGLRKWLHLNDDNKNELNVTASALKGKPIQLDNNITHTATESAEIKTKQPNAFHIAVDNANHSDSGISKQDKNVSQEEEQESLTKYLEDFISLVSSEGIAPSIEGNETTKHEAGPEPPPNAVSASAASKKENVTDLKNREIIVVSPKSLRDLMKNRSRNSSLPVVHKGIPITVNKAKNSTLKLDFSLNKTAVNVQGQGKNLSGNATIHHQVSKDRPTLQIVNDTSNKDSVTSKSENDDLNVLYRDELKSLEISLSRDFMSSWIYYQKSLDEIGITPNMLRSGIANLGSAQRLKKVFKKALAGTDLNVLVVGGSISAGGGLEKDRGNVEGVYHKAFSNWWNNTVTPITTSQLKINTVAIGGTDSEYFSYCIKNYMRSLPDIVIWELAANDYKRYTGRDFAPAKPLEQLTRIILSLPSHPALILANFFRGNYYKTAVDQDCPDSEDEGGKSIAQYYKLTSLSWRNVICSGENGKDLDLKKLFSSDGYHPSLLGHAQMSSLLISYFKGLFEQTISEEMIKLRNRTRQSLQHDVLPSLAEPIFDDPETPTPLCWTLLTPDYDQKLRNTLPDLEFTEATGFQFANISHWPIRRDRLRCLKAIQTGAMLKMKFNVPSRENNGGHSGSYKRELAVTTHNSFGGMGTLWLDGDQSSARIIKEQNGQRRTQVNVLTQTLIPGVHTVTVYALQPGFCLSAVAVL